MIIVCDSDASFRGRLADLVAEPATELEELSGVRAAVDQAVEPTVVVLGPHVDAEEGLRLASGLEDASRPVAVILIQQSLDTTVLRRALRSGVSDMFGADELHALDFQQAVDRALADARDRGPHAAPASAQEDHAPGHVVTVFSTKGGCGKSLVATNLAVLLAKDNHSVALVDLDLQSGDLAIMLQVMPSLSLYDAALATDRMDAEALRGYLTPHTTGLRLLAAPLEPSLSEAVTGPAVAKIMTLLRESFDYVIVDSPAFFTDQILAAIDQSSHVILVASLDVPSVKNLRTALTTLQQLGHPRERILTVLNRADSNVGLRVADVEKSLGTAIDVQLPSSRDVPMSINQGSPLAAERRRSDVVQAISRLLPLLTEGETSSDSRGRSLFSRRR